MAKPSKETKAKKFTAKEIEHITERDNHCCIVCGNYQIESTPHHVIFKGQGGLGKRWNGVSICRSCHNMGHNSQTPRSALILFEKCFEYLSSIYEGLTIDQMTYKKGRD